MRDSWRVAVVGDATIDFFAEATSKKTPDLDGKAAIDNWELREGLRIHKDAGGACLLKAMIEVGLARSRLNAEVYGYRDADLFALAGDHAVSSYADVKVVSLGTRDGIFVERFRGFSGPAKGLKLLPLCGPHADAAADALVIDDAGNGFRRIGPENWPIAMRRADAARLIILKMSAPLGAGQVWDFLKSRTIPDKDRLRLLVVSAEDLRAHGLDISRKLSWERSALDLCKRLSDAQPSTVLHELATFGHLVVRFGLEGAVHVNADGSHRIAALGFDPEESEDGLVLRGQISGRTNAFVAGLTTSLLADIAAGIISDIDSALRSAIVSGIHRSRQLVTHGFVRRDGRLAYPAREIFDDGPQPRVRWWNVPLSPVDGESYAILAGTGAGASAASELIEVARNVVLNGSSALEALPIARFGDLLLADRWSIEAYRSIANLFGEYLRRPTSSRPLSIAVFGPPGSGKSFGVKQIGNYIGTHVGAGITARAFNLAEFIDPQGLVSAFQSARDIALSGHVPLVFFDEFDTDLDGRELGWLKYFLGPMQDGEFMDGTSMRPIGRAIFVFAGGTAHSHADFSRAEDRQEIQARTQKATRASRNAIERTKKFESVKGPDFLSRLRGYVNIPGLNPPQSSSDRSGKSYLIRRAILLRDLLKRKAPTLFRGPQERLAIDHLVLDAFLQVDEYFHGARSMEAIIDMSLLSGRQQFELSALPANWQLHVHVHSSFTEIMARRS